MVQPGGPCLHLRALALGLAAAFTCVTASAAPYPRAGTTKRVSVTKNGAQAVGPKTSPLYDMCCSAKISANQRYVAFSSRARNLVPRDGNRMSDVFVKDLRTGEIERVSVSSKGKEGHGICTSLGVDPNEPLESARPLKMMHGSGDPSISGSGRYVAFISCATNLVQGDRNATADIFVHDRQTNNTRRASVSSSGEETPPHVSIPGRESISLNDAPQISENGRYVAFTSHAPNLVQGDTNNAKDVFVHDIKHRRTERVSESSKGEQGTQDGFSYSGLAPDLSANGRYVAFASALRNLVPSDDNGAEDTFVHDRRRSRTERVSVATDGSQADVTSFPNLPAMISSAFLSRNGRYVTFSHLAANLVPDDRNRGYDTFVHDRVTRRTTRVSVDSNGHEFRVPQDKHPQSYIWSVPASMSNNGRYTTFVTYSWFTDLAPLSLEQSDFESYDHYIHDSKTGATELLSDDRRSAKAQAGDTTDGRRIVFASDAPNLVAGDTNGISDVFLHDRGREVDTVRIHPGSTASTSESAGTAVPTLESARLVERSDSRDLFGTFELDQMASLYLPANGISRAQGPGTAYVMSFEIADKTYEVRVAASAVDDAGPGTAFALFECDSSIKLTCKKIADLEGGYGTTGASIVFAVPFDLVDLEGKQVRNVLAASGFGTLETGVLAGPA